MILHLIITVGLVYWAVLTADKHNFPVRYENWWDNLKDNNIVKKVLPEHYCYLCFVTQSSLMASFITALILGTPLLHTIILIPCSAAYMIYLDNTIQK